MAEARSIIRNSAARRRAPARPLPAAAEAAGKAARVEAATSIEKALDVLFFLHREREPQGVSQLARALGLPKSSAHRLLAALVRRGLVERDEGGRYRPGIALVALARGALEREPVVAAARPVLEAEAEALGETVFLVGGRGERLLVLDKAEGTGFLRAAPRVGTQVPVHATAVGKLFLAFGDGALAWPATPLERFTARTPATREALEREVARARRQGFAESREEWIPGLAVLAAPILAGGRLAAALAVAAPAQRLEALGRDAVAARMRAAAERIVGRLEGRVS
jgi:DNA-binding IclR family transcriptional regulator